MGEKSGVLFLLWHCIGVLEQVMDIEYKDQKIHGLNIVVLLDNI